METQEQYNARMRTYMLARYHERRAEAIELLGGCCTICGSTEDLDIDHVDPALKTMSVSKLWSVAKARYLAELKLCQLLCRPHHRQKTAAEQEVPHGGGASGKKNCRCVPCKARKAEYMRNYRAPVAEVV